MISGYCVAGGLELALWCGLRVTGTTAIFGVFCRPLRSPIDRRRNGRSEEHTSELQSLMRISYAVFCLKKKKKHTLLPTPSIIPDRLHLVATITNTESELTH